MAVPGGRLLKELKWDDFVRKVQEDARANTVYTVYRTDEGWEIRAGHGSFCARTFVRTEEERDRIVKWLEAHGALYIKRQWAERDFFPPR